MKVVFLDIDGVLVTERLFRRREGRQRQADDVCVAALNRILRETGAQIVISSSWRFCGHKEMQIILDFWNVDGRIIGLTPDLCTTTPGPNGPIYKAHPRGHEIQAWLNRHPEVTAFVILDDEADMAHLEPFMVKTEFADGLTNTHATRAIGILSGDCLRIAEAGIQEN